MALKVYHHRSCEAAATEAGRVLEAVVNKAKSPLVLLSGGSSLNAARIMIKRLTDKQRKKLTIAQVDARYVPFKDPNNNWHQIEQALSRDVKLNNKYAMMNYGANASEAAAEYSMILEDLLDKADVKVGLYGMGDDGHIAGITPKKTPSQFARFLDGRLVVSHKGPTYKRMTTTQEVIVRLDKVVAMVCGKNKYQAVKDLDKNLNPRVHPAQLFKDAKDGEVHVFVGRQ